MGDLPSLFANAALGLETAFLPQNLLWCLTGVALGTFIGVIPGVGALAAISMLFPLTFHLAPTSALIMLAGIWYGTAYGGSTAAILLNVPGTPSSAVSCLDGYPMSKQGRGGIALLMTALASFVGGSIGILIMMFFSPVIVDYAMKFGEAEYFALMLLALIAASTVSFGSTAKSLAMVAFGVLLGTVGLDHYTAVARFDFGSLSLYEGISLVGLAMGLFGVAEVAANVGVVATGDVDRKSFGLRAMVPTRDDLRRSWAPVLRGSGIGAFFGALPGVGPAVAAFVSYAVEKRIAKEPGRFGNGAIEGIVSPEASNNAADQTAFIPTMTLGLPGSPSMAIMLGALMIQGIAPGPTLMREHPDLFWGLVMSFWIGNVLLLVLNIPLVGIWIRMLMIPYRIMFPSILAFICIGIYTVNMNTFDVWLVAFFGGLGFLMRVLGFSPAPLILGFVLGPMMEEHFRRAMIIARGDFTVFLDRPLSAAILAATCLLLLWRGWQILQPRLRPAPAE
ncbi:tripartite tricarboxylate transporter permease [Propylenella binzhouense]|uniref:Tripartite tricarboxylate transporter permease n=1 Tax=Propylenella binzhouense TaxID=2555902 RepID=A0A964T9K2_9HYPH|nr:tripartite tricarboxylate transporter permease [Propylenella binzhouense]MYZ50294.1 tripartite tricarboxylate transporter permease [Propylenella binzhouense]